MSSAAGSLPGSGNPPCSRSQVMPRLPLRRRPVSVAAYAVASASKPGEIARSMTASWLQGGAAKTGSQVAPPIGRPHDAVAAGPPQPTGLPPAGERQAIICEVGRKREGSRHAAVGACRTPVSAACRLCLRCGCGRSADPAGRRWSADQGIQSAPNDRMTSNPAITAQIGVLRVICIPCPGNNEDVRGGQTTRRTPKPVMSASLAPTIRRRLPGQLRVYRHGIAGSRQTPGPVARDLLGKGAVPALDPDRAHDRRLDSSVLQHDPAIAEEDELEVVRQIAGKSPHPGPGHDKPVGIRVTGRRPGRPEM